MDMRPEMVATKIGKKAIDPVMSTLGRKP